MVTKAMIDDFLIQKKVAVVGVSGKSSKSGNGLFKKLKETGYTAYAVNPNSGTVEGETAYPDLKSLPEKVDWALLSVKPAQTEQVVKDAAEAGIKRIWMHLGSDSADALAFCNQNDITVIHKQGPLLFAQPVTGLHGFHRWVSGLFGALPK